MDSDSDADDDDEYEAQFTEHGIRKWLDELFTSPTSIVDAKTMVRALLAVGKDLGPFRGLCAGWTPDESFGDPSNLRQYLFHFPLYMAATAGDTDRVISLLQWRGEGGVALDPWHGTLGIVKNAAKFGHPDVLAVLLNHKTDAGVSFDPACEAIEAHIHEPILAAAKRGHVATMDFLFKWRGVHGVFIDIRPFSYCILYAIATHGQLGALNLVLAWSTPTGEGIDTEVDDGLDLLKTAARHGHRHIMEALVAWYAINNKPLDAHEALLAACNGNQPACLKFLLDQLSPSGKPPSPRWLTIWSLSSLNS
jgi:hypothetical protein